MSTLEERLSAMRSRLEQAHAERQGRQQRSCELRLRKADRRAEAAFQFGRAVIRRGDEGALAGLSGTS